MSDPSMDRTGAMERRAIAGPIAATIVVAGTGLSYAAGWAVGVPAFMPLLNTVAAYPLMYLSLRDGRTARAVRLMLLWALTMGVCSTALSMWHQPGAAAVFINAEPYRREMFAWLVTGVGAESDPARFVPQHLAHTAMFCGLSLATGSVASMPMGAVLMNYMGHYVGTLAANSASPAITAVLGWHPWAVIRIISFVTLGVVLGGPLLSRIGGFRFSVRAHRTWLLAAAGGLLADMVLKALLAPVWRSVLLARLGW